MAEPTKKSVAEVLRSDPSRTSDPRGYRGSAERIWALTRLSDDRYVQAGLMAAAVVVIALVWVLVTIRYMFAFLFFRERFERARDRRQARLGGRAGGARQAELIEEMRKLRLALEHANHLAAAAPAPSGSDQARTMELPALSPAERVLGERDTDRYEASSPASR